MVHCSFLIEHCACGADADDALVHMRVYVRVACCVCVNVCVNVCESDIKAGCKGCGCGTNDGEKSHVNDDS